MDYLVVGSGFAGSVCARQLANAGKTVHVVEKRHHPGGNAHDCVDEHGIRIHPYGPHIFHTNSKKIFSYLSQFTDWRAYEHRVEAVVDGTRYPFPINQVTINRLYGLNLDSEGMATFLKSQAVKRKPIRTSEDRVLASVGADLCERFFRGYTYKQWGLGLADLSCEVVARVPARTTSDCRYFLDRYQYMPADGYARLFQRLLDHPLITLNLNTDYFHNRDAFDARHVVFTGPVDAYFDYRYGPLPYRSLDFEHEHIENCEYFQAVGTVNYPNDHAYTRISEFKHLTGQQHSGTSIVREYPTDKGDPFYPVPRPENIRIYRRYAKMAKRTGNVTFVGRLAQYRYYNMDQAVASALKATRQLLV